MTGPDSFSQNDLGNQRFSGNPIRRFSWLVILLLLEVFPLNGRCADDGVSSVDDGVRRILFLAGDRSHGPGAHEYHAGCLLLAKALEEQSGLPVETDVVRGWPEDETLLERADALIVYDTATKIIGRHWETVDAMAKRGVGLMFIHYAVHPSAEKGRDYYLPWIGGAFETGHSVNPNWIADMEALPEHPVSRGIDGPVRAFDEFYYGMRFRPGAERESVLNLVTAIPTRDNIVSVQNLWTRNGIEGLGRKQTLMWGVEREDGGRGVGFTGGHFHRNWALDECRQLVLNAIAWVAGLEVPENGVVSEPVDEEPLNANLDDYGKPSLPWLTVPTEAEWTSLKRQPIPTVEENEERLRRRREGKRNTKENTNKTTTKTPNNDTKKAATAPPNGAIPPVDSAGESKLVPIDQLEVADDLEVTVWARSPLFFNPTNMDTDSAGRIWVAEGVNYRRERGRRPEGDRIVVLEDTDLDGQADSSHVFVQDPELISPLGVSVFGNRIVVAQPPNLIVYTDVDRDLRFDAAIDKRENLLTGFFGQNHDHSLHAVVGGPDGRWYWNHGNTGAEFTTPEGLTYRVGGPYGEGEKLAGQRSNDGRIWTGGFLARMNPDGTDLEMLGHGFRNSYEHAVSSLGDIFQNDNDDPPACRTSWLMEGGFLGFFSRSGKRLWKSDRRRGQSIPTAHWRQENPGTLPPGDVYGGGSPTGIAYYENGSLPDEERGLLLSAEARRQEIFAYRPHLEENGAGVVMERDTFLKAVPGTDFRPSDVMVGVDGAVYISDWFDSGVGGHGTRDDSLSGTIYRVAPKNFRQQVPTVERDNNGEPTVAGAIALLGNPAINVRFEGSERLRTLLENGDREAIDAVTELAANLKDRPWLASRATWLLPEIGDAGTAALIERLSYKAAEQRILAYRALRASGFDFSSRSELLDDLARDPSPAVRRAVAVSLRNTAPSTKRPLVELLFAGYDGTDRVYLEACGLAAEGIEDVAWQAIYDTENPDSAGDWSDRLARITWRLQPEAALPELIERVNDSVLEFDQRKLALDTIAFTRCEAAMAAMSDFYQREDDGDDAIRELAYAWLLVRAGDEWEDYGGMGLLKELGIYDPENVTLQMIQMPPYDRKNPPKSTLPSWQEIAGMEGDPMRGKVTATRCTMCHQIDGVGVDYGPDLRGWVENQGTEAFLKALINPHASIALGFEGARIPLRDGGEIHGILLSAADPLTVQSTAGVVQMVPRNRLDKRTQPLRRSLMLSADELGLTAQDLADLSAFFSTYD